MIKINLKNAVPEQLIQKYQKQVQKIAKNVKDLQVEGSDFLGWKNWPHSYDKVEFQEIIKTAKKLYKEHVEVLVVIGIGGSFAGAKAGLEMIKGQVKLNDKIKIIFAGESISSTSLAQKLQYVQDKNFAINVISKSGTTLEPAIAFRLFRKLLEEKVGIHNAAKFIVATTDANKGTLFKLAKANGYKTFAIPDNIGGRFSVLTAVGLFPLACAGIDIKKVIKGAQLATKKYETSFLQKNDAYRYAVARFILMKKYAIELLVQYEPQMNAFSEWWKQLAGESEGKNQKGLFPASAIFSTDLHSLGQFIQDGKRILFETVMTITNPKADVNLFENETNLDKLNYLAKKSVDEINKTIFRATTSAHVEVGKVPNIHIEYSDFNETTFGELVVFFEYSVMMTAYLMGVNPFNQPGVEVYKQNMFKKLGKTN